MLNRQRIEEAYGASSCICGKSELYDARVEDQRVCQSTKSNILVSVIPVSG